MKVFLTLTAILLNLHKITTSVISMTLIIASSYSNYLFNFKIKLNILRCSYTKNNSLIFIDF
jgi:hypothetical protein